MKDSFSRTIDYLRVSVTDRCNLRCVYCIPKEGVRWVEHGEVLRFEEITRLCAIFAGLGIRKVKVTGGEPLVRRGLPEFIAALKRGPVEQVTLTTNGVLLGSLLAPLVDAGIDAINISLDTLDEAVFSAITRSDALPEAVALQGKTLPEIKAVIKRLRETPVRVKINCVPIRGLNDESLLPLAEAALRAGIPLRFIELMPLGAGGAFTPVPEAEVRAKLEAAFGTLSPFSGILGNGPARYYSAAGFAGKIGFISAESACFCAGCNRLRLSSTGLLKPCLAADLSLDLKQMLRCGADDAAIWAAIQGIVAQKPERHTFGLSGHENKAMFRIGG
jgi:cyclic pyranopterin phosphate synthase